MKLNKFMVLCSGVVLTAGILIGCMPSKAEENQGVEKQFVGKYTMPDEKASMKVRGYYGRITLRMGKVIKKRLSPFGSR